MEDYYKTLGIDQNADAQKIKSAFRKLSLKHHPDKCGGDDTIFKEINEAYQTLSDSEKRQAYDFQKNNPFMRGMPGGMHMGGPPIPELFTALFGGGGPMPGMPMPFPWMHGGPSEGNMPNIRIFSNGRPVHVQRRMRKPVPIIKNIEITLEQAYTGFKYPLEIERWIGNETGKILENEKIYVTIPPGIDEDEMIKIKGKGNILSQNNKGDIKLFVKIKNETNFKRKGLDLIYKKTLTLKEALVGFNFDLTHLSKKTYSINNTNGKIITPGFNKVIAGMGMKREGSYGNLYISFNITFPETLSDQQIEKLKELL